MAISKLSLKHEKLYWNQGFTHVVGIDEVGRGCLAGPVVAAAVIFEPPHRRIAGIFDSKGLTAKTRELLHERIRQATQNVGIGVVSARRIDQIGIVDATFLAMEKAVDQLYLDIGGVALIDGKLLPKFIPGRFAQFKTMIKGDALCYSIAAASILAKVYRDRLMKKLSEKFREYYWDENKGYGTVKHTEAINAFGLTDFHRRSFCKKYLMQMATQSDLLHE